MKLVCSISLSNRLTASQSIGCKKKFSKSTLAICKHPNLDKYYIILFTGQDKTGSKYDVKENIERVLTKFVSDGKTTIQFKRPPHDIFIQADVIPLKTFLHLLQRILNGTISSKEISCSSLGVMPVSNKDIAPTKLVIKKRSEYPMKGFSRSLESLTITGINRMSLDLGILKLGKLRILDLSDNKISVIPEELNKMIHLKVLDISGNELFRSTYKDWNWLGGNLCSTLCSLNLARNELSFIPQHIIKLRNLNTLNLNENKLETLPNGIGRLMQLKELRMCHNMLAHLPGSIKNLKLSVIDISNNPFQRSLQDLEESTVKVLKVCTLLEYASQSVLDSKLQYNAGMIPATLVHFLDFKAKYCICGKTTFSVYLFRKSFLNITSIAKEVITSNDDLNGAHVPINCYFCSVSCSKSFQRSRMPLVR